MTKTTNTIEALKRLSDIVESDISIKKNIEQVAEIWKIIDKDVTDEERMEISSLIKSRVQKEVEESFYTLETRFGAALMGTGSGKSKIAIDISDKLITNDSFVNILLVVPTEKLRDEGWKDEFEKWGFMNSWNFVKRCCYASLNKYEGEHFHFVILDEGHNITENNGQFFSNNKVDSCLLLTATKPNDPIKIDVLKSIGIYPFFELSLDESVKLGLVAPYDVTVITTFLDTTDKYIPAGSKKKSFMNTEKGQYGYLSTRLLSTPNGMGFINRMRFIYNLKSKTEAAIWILENIIPQNLKTLIFCGSKTQANQVCTNRFYSKPTSPKKPKKETPFAIAKHTEDTIKYRQALLEYRGDISLDAFRKSEILRMSCVEALNEGENIDGLDVGFVIQLNSNDKDFIQRLGRIVRFRPGHTGRVIILCTADTVDKSWVEKAIKGLNPENIRWIELSHLKIGIEKIPFD